MIRSIRLQNLSRSHGLNRCLSTNTRVAIIGSGPAGFYTAKYLLERNTEVNVDIIEKLPVPYGLVRYGVAPDHPEVKSVQETFEKVATNPRFRFFGNVELEPDFAESPSAIGSNWMSTKNTDEESNVLNRVTLSELQKYYKGGIVLACGAENDRKLGLEYEDDCDGVLSARTFVNWYNGHPDYTHVGDDLDLSKIEDVVIVGQGNVAIDCARILTKSTEALASTDLCEHALAKLKKSAVKRVHVVGRRGTAQAAFTIKELRELTRLDGVKCIISASDMKNSMTKSSQEEVESNRARTRITELIQSIADASDESDSNRQKEIHLRFLLQPRSLDIEEEPLPFEAPFTLDTASKVELEVSPLASSSVGAKTFQPRRSRTLRGVTFDSTTLIGEAGAQKAIVAADSKSVTLPAQLLLKSVGYKSVALKGVPFDSLRAAVPHEKGRVICEADMSVWGGHCKESNKDDAEALLAKDGGMRQLSKTLRDVLGSPEPPAKEQQEQELKSGEASSRDNSAPLYVVGWLKRGPSGTIASSVADAKETAASLLEDLELATEREPGGRESVGSVDPAQRMPALRSSSAITWQRYRQIDTYEVAAGERSQPSKPRVKLTNRKEMVELKASLRKRAQERARQSKQVRTHL